ncbi:MAG: 6-phosphofructokinase [Pirellulales bacterium]|nr:6-phosphofructokinase [Pirellulales bacterium]
MSTSLSRHTSVPQTIRRAAILFAGGPAPAANAVISTAAVSFLRNNIDVVGILHGYSHLLEFGPDRPLIENQDYIRITHHTLKRTRNSRGILIGTARANPGKEVTHPSHLQDPERTKLLKTVYDALLSINVDALISIGGDDTLRTANKFKLFQEQLPPGSRRIPVVHLPKTIDNDYMGIDFTFGYFTAVEFLAGEIRNLLADAEASRSYFVVETMGRHAGWLSYGAAIAGEASLVMSVEDITGKYEASEQITEPQTGKTTIRRVMNLDEVIKRIVATMRTREEVEGKEFGVIVLAEGLAELLPNKQIKNVPRDPFGNIAIANLNLGKFFAETTAKEYARQTGRKRKVTGITLGYESRCALPQAFDVMLGSQLGVGAYRALVEKNLDGVMVSVSGQLDLNYVPFSQLVDPATLITMVRYIDPNSDFHRLARFLETYVND